MQTHSNDRRNPRGTTFCHRNFQRKNFRSRHVSKFPSSRLRHFPVWVSIPGRPKVPVTEDRLPRIFRHRYTDPTKDQNSRNCFLLTNFPRFHRPSNHRCFGLDKDTVKDSTQSVVLLRKHSDPIFCLGFCQDRFSYYFSSSFRVTDLRV